MKRPAQPRLDRNQPPQASTSFPAARSPTSTCPIPAAAGYTNFNRYFFAQLDKQALVLDERYNEGGLIADYIVDVLETLR